MGKKLKIEKSRHSAKWNISGKEQMVDTALLSGPHTEIFGNSRINIEGCLAVAEYRDTYIKLRLNKGTLILCGEDFDIILFENKVIAVKGKISSLEFCM